MKDVSDGCQQASGATAVATWTNVGLRILDQYIIPNALVQKWFGSRIASNAKAMPALVYNFD